MLERIAVLAQADVAVASVPGLGAWTKMDDASSFDVVGLRDVVDLENRLYSRGYRSICVRTLDQPERQSAFVALASRVPDAAPRGTRVLEPVLPILRLAVEQTCLRRRCIELEQFATVGRIAGAALHDLATPVASMILYAQEIQRRLATARDASKPQWESFDRLCDNAKRCVLASERVLALIRDLRTALHHAPWATSISEAVDVGELIGNTLCQLAPLTRSVPAFKFLVEPALPRITGVSTDLERAFVNLLVNAIDAVSKTSRGCVEVKVYLDEGFVIVEFSDNGPGIDQENLARIFEPFFTTKGVGGSGLGLYISRQIVEGHGGCVEVRSTPGTGTCFRVRLPQRANTATRPFGASMPHTP